MLGIDFLNKPSELRFDGQEFMDYQKGDLFKDLVKFLDVELVQDPSEMNSWVLKDFDRTSEGLEAIFMHHTGIKLELQPEGVANAAVDAGWFSPGNLLNIQGIENWFSASQSNIGHAFKALKIDVLKGWVDTSTGKVGGDFSKIGFKLYVNYFIDMFIREKVLKRYNVTMQEALAGILMHECGHVFTGFLYVYRSVIDPIIATTAIKLIIEGKKYGKDRVEIVKEAFKVLEVGQKVDEATVSGMSADQFVVYFNKAISTRDTRRTLSLGVQSRSSEIYADLYAIRMGCPKSMVAALAALPNNSLVMAGISGAYMAIAVAMVLICEPVLAVMAGVFSVLGMVMVLGGALTPTIYDTPYRRIKNILRDHIVQLNSAKTLNSRDKIKMLADAKAMEQMINENKPFLEGTAVQRTVGWMLTGGDFKAQDFEHYTEEMLGHTLSLYKEAF